MWNIFSPISKHYAYSSVTLFAYNTGSIFKSHAKRNWITVSEFMMISMGA